MKLRKQAKENDLGFEVTPLERVLIVDEEISWAAPP
jgi:hypothetical protein